MRNAEGPAAYEAYCFNCKVTFPIETRRCLHCGARVVPHDQKRAGRSVDHVTKQIGEAARRRASASASATREATKRHPTLEELAAAGVPGTAPGAALPNDDVDEILPTRRFSPMTMIWILLVFTGAAVRACGG